MSSPENNGALFVLIEILKNYWIFQVRDQAQRHISSHTSLTILRLLDKRLSTFFLQSKQVLHHKKKKKKKKKNRKRRR